MSASPAAVLSRSAEPTAPPAESLDRVSRRLVSDLHAPRPLIFWSDLLASAAIGWAAFAVALLSTPWTPLMLAAVAVSGFALYRGLCFTHELTHLRKRARAGLRDRLESALRRPAAAAVVHLHGRAPDCTTA